jgi:hypothetical protein
MHTTSKRTAGSTHHEGGAEKGQMLFDETHGCTNWVLHAFIKPIEGVYIPQFPVCVSAAKIS